MGKVIREVVVFAAPPHDVYELLMSSEKHAAFTGAGASISREIGGAFMAYDGYAEGRNIELLPGERIVQSWRASDWPEGIVSTITFAFRPVKGGTEMVFTQTGVPEEQLAEIRKGWVDFYWEPMHKAIGSRPKHGKKLARKHPTRKAIPRRRTVRAKRSKRASGKKRI